MEKTKLTDKQKMEHMAWCLELQVNLMKGTLELQRGREEAAFEDKEKLEYGTEWKLKLQEAYSYQAQADYTETTIKELERIIQGYKELIEE
jgi:hypothetical protein